MVDPRTQIEMYAWMRLARTFDEQMVAMWKQGRGLGGTFSGRGHEAISVGAGLALGDDDVVAPMHRDLGTYLVRGMSPERIFGNMLGKSTGASRGRDANLHGVGDLDLGIIGFISHLPQSLPTTLGVAMAFRYRTEPRVAMTLKVVDQLLSAMTVKLMKECTGQDSSGQLTMEDHITDLFCLVNSFIDQFSGFLH